jgi:hypothetical protein
MAVMERTAMVIRSAIGASDSPRSWQTSSMLDGLEKKNYMTKCINTAHGTSLSAFRVTSGTLSILIIGAHISG